MKGVSYTFKLLDENHSSTNPTLLFVDIYETGGIEHHRKVQISGRQNPLPFKQVITSAKEVCYLLKWLENIGWHKIGHHYH